jgi:hypothetical protein
MQPTQSPGILTRQELILALIQREMGRHKSCEMAGGRKLPFDSDPQIGNAVLILMGFNERQRGESLYTFYDGIMGQAMALSKTANEHLIHQMASEVYKQLLTKHLDYLPEYKEDM